MSIVLADTEDTWTEIFPRAARTIRCRSWRSFPARWAQPAASRRRRWVPSTARPIRRSTSTSASTASCAALRRARRFRAGLRHRARSRPPRAEPARHQRKGAVDAAARRTKKRPSDCRCAWNCRRTASPASGRNHANRTRQILEDGDVEEALSAASRHRRRPAAARVAGLRGAGSPSRTAPRSSACDWFKRGLESGKIDACDTFAGAI